jgi:hypothetical protein
MNFKKAVNLMRRIQTHQIILIFSIFVIGQAHMTAVQAQDSNETTATFTPPASANATQTSAIDSTFLRGKELYEKGEFGDALKYFNAVLALDSEHEFAREYSKLAQQWLLLIAQQGFLEWSVNFNARQFNQAAATYMKIRSDPKPGSPELAGRIEAQYQKALSTLVNEWNGACAARDLPKLEAIRNEASAIAAGLPFSSDTLAQMRPCASPATTANPAKPVIASKTPAPSAPSPPSPVAPRGVSSSPTPSAAPVTSIPATPSEKRVVIPAGRAPG